LRGKWLCGVAGRAKVGFEPRSSEGKTKAAKRKRREGKINTERTERRRRYTEKRRVFLGKRGRADKGEKGAGRLGEFDGGLVALRGLVAIR